MTGTCLTHIFEVQAATRQVVLDSLELTVEGEVTPRFGKGITAPARYQNIRYNIRIESPASAAEIDGLREAVEGKLPVVQPAERRADSGRKNLARALSREELKSPAANDHVGRQECRPIFLRDLF